MFKSFRPSVSALKRNHIRFYGPSCCPIEPCDRNIQMSILPNGIRVATEYQPSPISCMALFVEAGSRFESAYYNGITHFLEHMAYKGYCGMTKCELEMCLLNMGATMSAETSREIQSFSGIFPTGYASTIFDKLAGVVTNLELDNSEIDAEKYNICLEMVDEENDPRAVTFDYLHQTAFQGTPLAQRVIGPSRNVQRFDRDFVINYLCSHYQPYKLCIVTSGNVEHKDILCHINNRLGHLVGDPCCASDEGPTRFTGSQVVYRDDSMPFAHVAIAFEAPGYYSGDYWKLLIASRIMGKWHKTQGGGMGNASRLARVAACDEICESFESFYITYRDIGLWGIYFVARMQDVEDMVENIQKQWMSLCITTQYTDMERAINALKLELALEMSGVVKSCHDMGKQLLYTCTRKSLEDKYCSLSKLKVADVRDSAEKVLYDRCPAVAAVGPTETLPDYNRIRAGQYWLRL